MALTGRVPLLLLLGAAALVLMPLSEAQKRGARPLARIVAHASHARLPAEFSIAPVNG